MKTPGHYAAAQDLFVDILPSGVVRADNGKALLIEYRYRYKAIGLKTKQINDALRLALLAAGAMWIKVFLPQRFNPSYARMALGCRSTKTYDDWKAANVGKRVSWTRQFAGFTPQRTVGEFATVQGPQPTPFVLSGTSKESALASAYPVATVTSNSAKLTVKLQIGAINFRNRDTFTRVPMQEYERVVQEAERFLRKNLGQRRDSVGTQERVA